MRYLLLCFLFLSGAVAYCQSADTTTHTLDSVVISTGLQQIPKERSTGSFELINAAVLHQQVGSTILDRLNGVSTSVLFDPSKTPSAQRQTGITIRGLSTINGSQDPLIILDNFPYSGDLASINPNDIASVSLLKDAAATSIWGSRAGNGVIVLTSKKGKANQPMQLEFNANTQVTEKPDLYSLSRMPSGDYIGVEQFLYRNGFYGWPISNPSMPALSPALDIFIATGQGSLTPSDSAARISQLAATDVRRQYLDHFYQTGVNQQYALNLHGGTPVLQYYLSGGYDLQRDVLNAFTRRISLNLNNTYTPFVHFQLHTGLVYTQTNTATGKPAYESVTVGGKPLPYLSFADDQGRALPVSLQYRAGYVDTAGGGLLRDWHYYPLSDYQHARASTHAQQVLLNLGVSYQLFKGLQAEVNYNYQLEKKEGRTLYDAQSYYARNLLNLFSVIDPSTHTVHSAVPDGGILEAGYSTINSQNLRGQLNYGSEFGRHSIYALAGAELRQTTTDGSSGSTYGYNDQVLTSGLVDGTQSYPTFIDGSYQYIPTGNTFTGTVNRNVSLFGNASYSYQQCYTLTTSLRRDASNVFGVATNDQWKPFWSAGGAWTINRETFYRWGLVPQLKFRLTYGVSGTVDPHKSAATVLYLNAAQPPSNLPFASVSQFNNPSLRWERVNMVNAGLDFAFRGNGLSGSLEAYYKRGTDLFGPAALDYTAGLRSDQITRNVAAMHGYGVDLHVQSVNLRGPLQWTTTWLFSYSESKTSSYYFSPGQRFTGTYGTTITPVPGKALYGVLSYRFAGLDPATGNPQGYLNKQVSTDYYLLNNVTSPDSLQYAGSASPRFFGAIGNTFSFRRFSLGINLTYQLGYSFRRPTISYDQLFNSGIGHGDFARRWQQPGDEAHTTVPSLVYPNSGQRDQFYGLSAATVSNASHVRLQFVNMGYDFAHFHVYVNASNLGLLWKANRYGIDPAYPTSLPPFRAIALGVRASF